MVNNHGNHKSPNSWGNGTPSKWAEIHGLEIRVIIPTTYDNLGAHPPWLSMPTTVTSVVFTPDHLMLLLHTPPDLDGRGNFRCSTTDTSPWKQGIFQKKSLGVVVPNKKNANLEEFTVHSYFWGYTFFLYNFTPSSSPLNCPKSLKTVWRIAPGSAIWERLAVFVQLSGAGWL